jgi:uridylate kinase
MKNPTARRYRTMSYNDAILMEGVEIMDTAALAMCKDNNLPIMVFKLFDGDKLLEAVKGEDVGTYVANNVDTELA